MPFFVMTPAFESHSARSIKITSLPISALRQRISAERNIHHGAWLHSVMLQFEDVFRVGQRIRMSVFGLLDWFRRKGIE